jgi:hypothetical protein
MIKRKQSRKSSRRKQSRKSSKKQSRKSSKKQSRKYSSKKQSRKYFSKKQSRKYSSKKQSSRRKQSKMKMPVFLEKLLCKSDDCNNVMFYCSKRKQDCLEKKSDKSYKTSVQTYEKIYDTNSRLEFENLMENVQTKEQFNNELIKYFYIMYNMKYDIKYLTKMIDNFSLTALEKYSNRLIPLMNNARTNTNCSSNKVMFVSRGDTYTINNHEIILKYMEEMINNTDECKIKFLLNLNEVIENFKK